MILIRRCLLGGALAALLNPPRPGEAAEPPIIHITLIPRAHSGGEMLFSIGGEVKNVPDGTVVVLWARNREGLLWVQPWGNAYHTKIDPSGGWKTETHPGLEYTAVVAKPSFRTPMVRTTLPPIGDEILALTTVAGRP